MAYSKKTWTDRLVEHPNRRTITDTTSGDVQTVDVARAEGEVGQAGDAFNATNMNDMEGRIESGLNEKLNLTGGILTGDLNMWGAVNFLYENESARGSFEITNGSAVTVKIGGNTVYTGQANSQALYVIRNNIYVLKIPYNSTQSGMLTFAQPIKVYQLTSSTADLRVNGSIEDTNGNSLSAKQNKTLDTPIVVEEVQQTTVEGALQAINNKSVTITVDDAMSDTSENPVQNKVITEALDDKADVEKVSGYSNTWSTKTWTGLPSFYGSYVWTDGENIYYSSSSDQYVLDKSTSTWTQKTWTGLTSFNGEFIWTDGDNIYYSYYADQYVLDKSTSAWIQKTWTGLTIFNGLYVWTDGENIYYSSGLTQYILDKSTSTWTQKTWSGLTSFDGSYIWTDGDNIYFSYGSSKQYVLDKSTSTWSQKSWSGMTNYNGYYVWTDGNNIYYSYPSNQYVLNKSTSTWVAKTWNGLSSFYGYDTWTDGDNIYYSSGSVQYMIPGVKATVIEDAITIKPNGDIKAAGEIEDGGSNVLSEKYDANSLAFQNYRVEIPASGWSSTAVDGYYTQTVTLPYPVNTYKKVDIDPTGADDSTDQTSAEAVAYSCLKHFRYAEGTGVTSATLYASSKPTTTFYCMVSGYYMTKNAATSGVAQDITTANKLNVYDADGNKVAEFNGSATVNIYYRSKIVSVPYTGWSSVVDANGYYTQSIDLVDNYNSYDTPDIYLCGSTNDTEATAAEQAAWSLINRVWMADSTATHTLILYAKTKPTTTFYIRVKGSYIG